MFNLHKNDTLVIIAGINGERILEKMEDHVGPIDEKFNPNNSKSSKQAKSQALG